MYLFAVLEVLLPADLQQTLLLDGIGQRLEAELGASGGQRLDDPVETAWVSRSSSRGSWDCVMRSHWPADVVADEAEACGARLFLHGASESRLSRAGHRVGLVQDDDLKRWTGLPAAFRVETHLQKRLGLAP